MLSPRTARVRVLAHTTLNMPELDSYLNVEHLTTPEKANTSTLIEAAGRVCYSSFSKPSPGTTGAYIRKLLEQGHGSVLEHYSISFIITGISRSCSHEIVRHRAGWSYSQQSQRYVDANKMGYVVPPAIEENPNAREALEKVVEGSIKTYQLLHTALRGSSVTPYTHKQILEAARAVLPNCTSTELVATGNVRAIRHFIEMRSTEHADAEIRRVAYLMYCRALETIPECFEDYAVEELPDGSFVLDTPFRKV